MDEWPADSSANRDLATRCIRWRIFTFGASAMAAVCPRGSPTLFSLVVMEGIPGANSGLVRLRLFSDPACPLCRQFRKWIDHLDREGLIEIVALDDPRLPERFPQLDLERAKEFLTVCDRLGRMHEGVEAMRQLTRHLPGLRRLQWVYRLPGVTPTLRGVYRTAHRHRKKLCLSCGEKWMPSLKYSRRKKNSRSRRSR